MSEVDPNVLAQLHRIHAAVNHGTLDKDTVNDALRLIHDLLSGAAYETAESEEAEEGNDESPPDDAPPEDRHVYKRAPRKKR